MRISLVIPAYNEEKYIGATLQSVFERAPGAFEEVIVVDNASTDETAKVAASFPGVRVVMEPRKGTGFAREAGFQATGPSDLIAFIDADTRMRASWPQRIERAFARDARLACITGPYWLYDLPPLTRTLLWLNWQFAFLGNLFDAGPVTGGNMVLRRSVLERMHGFNTDITFHGDDVDTGMRAGKFGKVRFSPRCTLDSSGRRYRAVGTLRLLMRYWTASIQGALSSTPNYRKDYEEVR